MANVKKGKLTQPQQMWKHLWHGWDRIHWKRERLAEKRLIREELEK